MRLRNIPRAEGVLKECSQVIETPEEFRGHWASDIFQNDYPVHIEIGTGKGRFLMALAQKNPQINYIGIERYTSVLLRAVEKSNSCRFATNCPVRDELQKPEKTGENYLPRQPVQRKRIRSDTAAGTSEYCKNGVSGRDTEIDTSRDRL